MSIACAALALAASTLSMVSCQSAGASNGETRTCEVRLKDGAYIVGAVRGLGPVALRSRYGLIRIPLVDIVSIRLGDVEKEDRDSVVTKEGTLRGWLDSWRDSVEVGTRFGTLRVPLKEVKSIDFAKASAGADAGTWPAFVPGEPGLKGPAFVVRMRNGHSLRGALRLRELALETKYGTLKIPAHEVRSLRFGGDKPDVIVTPEGPLEGRLRGLAEELALDTGYGMASIPTKEVAGLHQTVPNRGFGDDFESGKLDGWTSYGGSWKVVGGCLEVTGTNNYNTVVLFNEDVPESYTVEVECQGAQGFGILWNAQSQANATALWLNGAQTFVLGSATGSWWSWRLLAQWNVTFPGGQWNRVRIDVEGETATVWINEAKVGTVNAGAKGGKLGLFCYTGTAKFDNFWIR